LNTDVDVAIVGGGAAGIGAARRLAQSNYSTVLLEAGPRLGGRAWTHEGSGLRLDLGCGWFHSAERNSWIAIAEAAGVPIDRRPAQWGNQYRDLGFPKSDQAKAHAEYAEWMQRLEHAPPASDCVADALASDGEWNDYIRAIVGFISGASSAKLSIADYLAYDEASSENNWRMLTGYGALVARSFPSQVALHLATPVDSIALEPRGVTVVTPAGSMRARTAIVTVSTNALAGDIMKLPTELAPWREAASRLPLGRNEKLFFEISGDAPFETETQLLGNPRDVRTASYYIRPLGSRVIECFFGGEGARFLEESGHAAGFDFALAQLSTLFGAGIRGSLRPLTGSTWSQMKHIGGAYSYALPGQTSARSVLARPFDDRLFFAGEATSAVDFSTAHGAHDTGVRAAEEAIEAMGKSPPN
jgi:monoamine oxidase